MQLSDGLCEFVLLLSELLKVVADEFKSYIQLKIASDWLIE